MVSMIILCFSKISNVKKKLNKVTNSQSNVLIAKETFLIK